MFVSSAHFIDNTSDVREQQPKTWRRVRRFNRPVQLAVAAAERALLAATDPSLVELVALAPCQAGSPEVLDWARKVNARAGKTTPIRANPTHGLHAVDNLALSAVAIAAGSKGRGVGLGGAAGQAWEALDIALRATSDEVLLLCGDQERDDESGDLGGAVLLSRVPARSPSGRIIEIISVERQRERPLGEPAPHAARGLAALFATLDSAGHGQHSYVVPARDGDGFDTIVVMAEVR